MCACAIESGTTRSWTMRDKMLHYDEDNSDDDDGKDGDADMGIMIK